MTRIERRYTSQPLTLFPRATQTTIRDKNLYGRHRQFNEETGMMLRWTGRQVLLAATVLACVATGPGVPAQAESIVRPMNFASRQPWGVLISESFSRSKAIQEFNRIQQKFPADLRRKRPMVIPVTRLRLGTRQRYSARIGAASRKQADTICSSLRARSVVCIVRRTGG